MKLINSKNRTPAKRLLNNFYPSTDVRMMTMQQLNEALARAINNGLLTIEGAKRALNIQDDYRGKQNEDYGRGEARDEGGEKDERDHGYEGYGSEGEDGDFDGDDGSKEGESEGESDSESQDGDQGESESDSNGESEGEGDSESESESDDESEEGEEGDESGGADDEAEDEDDEDEDKPLRHQAFDSILKWISAGVNVALVGPAGSGKSTIVEHVCEALNKEFRGTGAVLSKYDLVGYKDANGTYHETPLYEAFTQGMLFCFDEFDASAPEAGVAFNAITDHQRFYAFPNGQQEKHADFVAVCCMNTWGNGATSDYVGRFKQDAASMSRFVKVRVDYDRKIEARIAGKKNLDIAQRVWDLRDACTELGIRHVVSTRMIVQAVAGRAAKCTKAMIDSDVLFAGLDDGAVRQLKSKMAELARGRK